MRESVQRGAAFLDEHYPGWRQRINLETLDMRFWDYCVLGQAISPDRTFEAMGKMNNFDLQPYGFVAPELDPSFYPILTELWKEEIANGQPAA